METGSLVCAAPAQAATTGSDAGGRGLKYEVWISTEGEGESPADTLSTDAADYRQTVLDGSRCEFGWLVCLDVTTVIPVQYRWARVRREERLHGAAQRLPGGALHRGDLLLPRHQRPGHALRQQQHRPGQPQQAQAIHKRQVRQTFKVSQMQFYIFLHSCRTVVGLHNTRHRTEAISVEEGKLYYLEVHHVQRASKAEANLLQVSPECRPALATMSPCRCRCGCTRRATATAR